MRTWLGALTLLALGACSTSPEQTEKSASPILGGAPDTTDTSIMAIVSCFGPCVFASDGSLNADGLCSSVLVAPNLLVTARHCVAPVTGGGQSIACATSRFGATKPANQFVVTPAPSIFKADPWLAVEAIDVVPDGDKVCGNDLAVVRLAHPYVKAVPFVPNVLGAPSVPQLFTAIGYGDDTPTSGGGYRRRLDTVRLDCLGPSCPFLGADGKPVVASTEFEASYGTCAGDSGGPAVAGGNLVLGVVSRGDDTCHHIMYTRLDSYGPWLQERARAAAMAGGYPVPAWAIATLDAGVADAAATDAAVDAGPLPDFDAAAFQPAKPQAQPLGAVSAGGGCDVARPAGSGTGAETGAIALVLFLGLRRRRDRSKLLVP